MRYSPPGVHIALARQAPPKGALVDTGATPSLSSTSMTERKPFMPASTIDPSPSGQSGPWQYPLKERIERHLEAVQNQHRWHRDRSPWGPPVAPPALLGKAAQGLAAST